MPLCVPWTRRMASNLGSHIEGKWSTFKWERFWSSWNNTYDIQFFLMLPSVSPENIPKSFKQVNVKDVVVLQCFPFPLCLFPLFPIDSQRPLADMTGCFMFTGRCYLFDDDPLQLRFQGLEKRHPILFLRRCIIHTGGYQCQTQTDRNQGRWKEASSINPNHKYRKVILS